VKNGVRQELNEVAGSLGDLGTFLPLAIGLIAVNGVNPTALFLCAGLLYIGAGLCYGLPIPVQPLKATAAIAISLSVPAEAIRAVAFWVGALLLAVSLLRPDAWLPKIFTRPVVRGIQLGLAVLLVRDVLHLPREAVVAASVGLVTLLTGNLAAGFLFGFGLERLNGRLFRIGAGEAREEAALS